MDWLQQEPVGAGGRFHRAYGHDGKIVDHFIAYYPRQGQGAELIGWENRIADGKIWRRLAEDRADIWFDGYAVGAVECRLGSCKRRRVVWHWYWYRVDGAYTTNPVIANFLQARARLLGGDRRAALVAVSVRESGNRSKARATMRGFLDGLRSLGSMLERATAVAGTRLADRPTVTPPARGR